MTEFGNTIRGYPTGQNSCHIAADPAGRAAVRVADGARLRAWYDDAGHRAARPTRHWAVADRMVSQN